MVGTYTEGDEPVPGFRLSQLLGWGRFGEVWRASGPGGITVAVKIIPLSNRQGLKEFRAIRLVKQIRHPNLVPIMAFWLKDRQGNFIDDSLADDADSLHALASELLIVMGLGEKSLHDRLLECAQEGRCGIPLDELLSYMLDAARAIDYLNRRAHLVDSASVGIQHCDIKPHNILIVGGVAQLCDLGVARVLEDNRASAATGSAAYIAPEFIRTGKPSCATDQYSLGVTYIELRTGLLPFLARSAAAAYLVHLNGELDLSGLSTPEREVIARATFTDPADRFPSCVAFIKALAEACARIPPEEHSLIEGVARLNASGLIAGNHAAADGSKCFGPFHTSPAGTHEEDLALSDVDDDMSSFIHPSNMQPEAARKDETDTVDFRLPPLPSAMPLESVDPEVNDPWQAEVAPGAKSTWTNLANTYTNNVARLKMWLPQSGRPSGREFSPRQVWNRLSPRHKRLVRYGSQLALLAVLGIAAGRATSSFSAAERSKSDQSPASVQVPTTSLNPGGSVYDAALALRKEGKYAEALAELDRLLAAQPADPLGHLYRAELETECGQLERALEDSTLASKGTKQEAAARACRARIYLAKGDFAKAKNECEQVLKYDCQNAPLLYIRSQALTGLKKYGPAIADYRSARAALPRLPLIQPSTALAVARGGITIDASKGTDLKPRIEIWRDRTDPSPRRMDGGPAAALAEDGQTMATATEKNEIKLVDLAGKQPERLLEAKAGTVTALVFCRDSRWLAAAYSDRVIRVWDLASGNVACELDGHTNLMTCLAYCPGEDLLASGSSDQTIRLWDLKKGVWVRTLTGHDATINALAFAPHARLLASGGADKLIKFWDASTGAEISSMAGHSAEVTSLAFSKDGRTLASGSADLSWPLWPGQVKLWNTVTGTLVTTFGGHPGGVFKLDFEPDSNRLISAGADFELRSWDVTPFLSTTITTKK